MTLILGQMQVSLLSGYEVQIRTLRSQVQKALVGLTGSVSGSLSNGNCCSVIQ
jgi:hypothetical protein